MATATLKIRAMVSLSCRGRISRKHAPVLLMHVRRSPYLDPGLANNICGRIRLVAPQDRSGIDSLYIHRGSDVAL